LQKANPRMSSARSSEHGAEDPRCAAPGHLRRRTRMKSFCTVITTKRTRSERSDKSRMSSRMVQRPEGRDQDGRRGQRRRTAAAGAGHYRLTREKEVHMDIVSDPAFWGDTGLVVASRLAVLATALWIARLAVRGWTPRSVRRPEPQRRPAAAPARSASGPAVPAPRYVDLRSSRPSAATAIVPRADGQTQGDHLRNRLMEYLDQRATERTPS